MNRFLKFLSSDCSAVLLAWVASCSAFAQSADAPQPLVFDSVGSPTRIHASLWKPPGDGPFPAIVIMHDCSGMGRFSSGAPRRWANELLPQGYVVLLPDSFSPRGLESGVCTVTDPKLQSAVNGQVRAADALGALAALRDLTYVDKKRIAIMGGSHGGWATLTTMAQTGGPHEELKRAGFIAGIALYPSCLARYGDWTTQRANGNIGPMVGYAGFYRAHGPVLILAGAMDDWTPAEPCRVMVEASRKWGQPIDIRIYPGAHHSFDSDSRVRFDPRRNNGSVASGRGATTGGDPAAWAAARREVAEFFAAHLKPAR